MKLAAYSEQWLKTNDVLLFMYLRASYVINVKMLTYTIMFA